MIYIFLNAGLAAFLIWTAVNINTKNQGTESKMVNLMLVEIAAVILNFCSLLSASYGPEKLSVLLQHSVLFFVAFAMIEMNDYFLTVQKQKASVIGKIIKWLMVGFAFYVSFFGISIANYETFELAGDPVFKGNLAQVLPVTWLTVYGGFFLFIAPAFSLLVMLLNAENSNSRLAIQRSIMCIGSVVFGWVGAVLIFWISYFLPMMRSLSLFVLGTMSVLLLRSASTEKVYDGQMIFSTITEMFVEYFMPALCGAFVFVILRPIYDVNAPLYFVIVIAVVFGLMETAWLVSKAISKVTAHSSSYYERAFERALANINYESDLKAICEQYLEAFRQHVQTKDITALIDSGTGDFVTGYSSNDLNLTFPIDSKIRDIIMNNGFFVISREEIDTNYRLQPVKDALENIFDQAEAEILIVLHEGNHIVGVLCLSQKRTGSSYDEYDKQVFDKMYSYFFVFGYYLKNIANASVVGTVNREIRMSSQIITSIQENMDFIKNPKVDVGYLMVPAHNIGGEFVDFIRLSKSRHIMIIGSLSGRGISASMSMVILKSVIRTYLADTHDFKKLIQKVNYFIRTNLPKGTFFAGLFCLMDFENDTMYYVNCGIPALLMYSKQYNNIIEIQGKGYVLGFVKDISPLIKVKQYNLTAGDMFALSTSGLITSHSLRGEQFGKDRIKQGMMDNYTYPANRIVRFMFDQLQQFMSKELEDDITMLVVRYFGKDAVTPTVEVDSEEYFIDDAPVTGADAFDAEALFDSIEVEETVDKAISAQTESEAAAQEPAVEEAFEQPVIEEELPDIPDFDMNAVADSNTSDDLGSPETFDISQLDDNDMFKDDLSEGSKTSSFDINEIVDSDVFDPEVFNENPY
ncbi:MAG: serine/threonine-protein phosphatase [Treponema sp.]|nr:serine/threonine-protein phosphatase [Treponema sp.]